MMIFLGPRKTPAEKKSKKGMAVRLSKEAKSRRKKFLLFLAFSLVVHLFVFFFLPIVMPRTQENTEPEALMVDLDTESLEQAAADANKQIVNTQKSDNKQVPEKYRFLGEHNQAVTKETRARKVDIFAEGGGLGKGQAASKASVAPQITLKSLSPQHSISAKPDPEGNEEQQRKLANQQMPTQAGDGAQQAANNDYLKDVAEGEKTLLNTKEFVYFGYYHRIRSKLEQAWNNRIRSVFQQSGWISTRALAGNQSYLTRLVVTLDRHGRIINIQVLEASGTKDLDQAAVEAFNQAGPFPDPPSGLVEKDGKIRVPWGFHVST